jgi:bleomycin hydrolase
LSKEKILSKEVNMSPNSNNPRKRALSFDFIEEEEAKFRNDPTARLAQNAVTKTTADDVAMDREIVTEMDFSFSTRLDSWTATNQKRSGRCWMFAALNLLRVGAMEKMNLKDFEFSQNYTLFWDKFERSNYFLEAIIDTAAHKSSDRLVAFLLSQPLSDGGQWNMAVNVIQKHGLVPKSAMPETESSSNTRRMNSILTCRLRQGARDIRLLLASGGTQQSLAEMKSQILTEIWRVLCIHLGTPPRQFMWQWRDSNGNFNRDGMMTPLAFAQKYVTIPIEEYVCLVHDPRPENPFGKTYTVSCLGNVVGGKKVVYLNIEIDQMKKITRQLLESQTPVWFGCDVGKQMRRDMGVWDAELFDYKGLYGIDFGLSKADRLTFHQTSMTHAMLFTGVDVVGDTIRKWRVENSWGTEKSGQKGFYAMNDSWFDAYMFEIAAPRSLLTATQLNAFDEEPRVLPAWDPMGALARNEQYCQENE